MTVDALATCERCGVPFKAKRRTRRFCSQGCKQAAYRNAGHHGASPVPNRSVRQDGGELVRVWGPGKLSEIECRVLGIEPTGKKAGNAWLYRLVESDSFTRTISVATAATDGKPPGPGVLPNASAPGGDLVSRRVAA